MSDVRCVRQSAIGKNSGQPQHLPRKILRHQVTNLKHGQHHTDLITGRSRFENRRLPLSEAKQTPASRETHKLKNAKEQPPV